MILSNTNVTNQPPNLLRYLRRILYLRYQFHCLLPSKNINFEIRSHQSKFINMSQKAINIKACCFKPFPIFYFYANKNLFYLLESRHLSIYQYVRLLLRHDHSQKLAQMTKFRWKIPYLFCRKRCSSSHAQEKPHAY